MAPCVTSQDLRSQLHSAVVTGRTGSIVNVRLHWETATTATPLPDLLLTAVELADSVLALEAMRWTLRTNNTSRLLHLMGVDAHGRTVVVSVARSEREEIQLTVFGNHGVIRLDRATVSARLVTASELQDRPWLASLDAAITGLVHNQFENKASVRARTDDK